MWKRVLRNFLRKPPADGTEVRTLHDGWSDYARAWNLADARSVGGEGVRFLGDEWTQENVEITGGTSYGLPEEKARSLREHLKSSLVDPFLPRAPSEGLEIGPGGGRATEVLLPKARVLHLLDSVEMLDHLRRRFPDAASLRYHPMDGRTLPDLPGESLDFVFSFDTFVHFEPRLTYWYLKQMVPLLLPGGIGIVHYSDVLTPIGWRQFENDLQDNIGGRSKFYAFGVMCRPLMRKFLDELGLRLIAEPDVIPRDAVAVFEKPAVTGR
jgi:SAM-dependent methyltransferase